MNKTALFRFVLLLIVGIAALYYFILRPYMAPMMANLGTPKQVTITWDGKTFEIPESSPHVEEITHAVERAFDQSSNACKCVFTPEELTKGNNSVTLVLPEPKQVLVKGSVETYIHKIIVPLSGKFYDDENLIASGSLQDLGGIHTTSLSLRAIKSKVETAVHELSQ